MADKPAGKPARAKKPETKRSQSAGKGKTPRSDTPVTGQAQTKPEVNARKPARSGTTGAKSEGSAVKKKGTAAQSASPRLLSGGNPQIPKGYGDAPVQAYLTAMPGWKSQLGKRLDAIIQQTVPHVYKAVKWNSPLYGIEGDGWFLGLHCFTKYLKVAFFQGASLTPLPPGTSRQQAVRYLDIYENDELDERQFADWVRQASQLPGERM